MYKKYRNCQAKSSLYHLTSFLFRTFKIFVNIALSNRGWLSVNEAELAEMACHMTERERILFL